MSNIKLTESSFHSVLAYSITEAIRHQKSVKFKIQVPYSGLLQSNGLSQDESYDNVGLTLEGTLKWEELDEEVSEVNELWVHYLFYTEI